MNCPECGVENKDSDHYCAACGAALHSGNAPATDSKPDESHNEVSTPPPAAAATPSAIKEPTPSSGENNNSKRNLIIVIAVVILLLCCCCLVIGVIVSMMGSSFKDLDLENLGSSGLTAVRFLI